MKDSRRTELENAGWRVGDTQEFLGLSDAELAGRAESIAGVLQRVIRPEQTVGVFAHRTVDMIAAMLGILRAGGAYVPLDPDDPPEWPVSPDRPLLWRNHRHGNRQAVQVAGNRSLHRHRLGWPGTPTPWVYPSQSTQPLAQAQESRPASQRPEKQKRESTEANQGTKNHEVR